MLSFTISVNYTDQLTSESVNGSWDRIKVICTQPYKRDAQYGLAFIRLASASSETGETSPEAPGPTMMRVSAISFGLLFWEKNNNGNTKCVLLKH